MRPDVELLAKMVGEHLAEQRRDIEAGVTALHAACAAATEARLHEVLTVQIAKARDEMRAQLGDVLTDCRGSVLELRLQLVEHLRTVEAEVSRLLVLREQTETRLRALRDGRDGEPGPAGERGLQGVAGQPGPQGPAGPPGTQGERGEAGAAGAAGSVGPAGPAGEPGAAGTTGERGEQGERGERGEPGEAGAAGLAGPAGDPGVQGDKGATGERGADGERGLQGLAGEPGLAGERGAQGERGLDGQPGADGLPGTAGDRGERGERGLDGQRGADGAGIDSPVWVPGVYREGTVAQHHLGQFFRALRDTAAEPAPEAGVDAHDWQRIGTAGLRLCGAFDERRTYTSGDIFVRDFGAFVHWAGDSRLLVGRGKAGAQGERGTAGRDGKDGKAGRDGADGVGVADVLQGDGGIVFAMTDGSLHPWSQQAVVDAVVGVLEQRGALRPPRARKRPARGTRDGAPT